MKLGIIRPWFAASAVVFWCVSVGAIARADDGSTMPAPSSPSSVVATFHAGHAPAPVHHTLATSGHVQLCNVDHAGNLVCTAPARPLNIRPASSAAR